MSKDVALPRNRLAGGWPILDLMDSSGDTWRSSLASLPAQSVGLVLPYCVGTSQVSPQYLFWGVFGTVPIWLFLHLYPKGDF